MGMTSQITSRRPWAIILIILLLTGRLAFSDEPEEADSDPNEAEEAEEANRFCR